MNFIKKISYFIIEFIDKNIHQKKIIFCLNQIINRPKIIVDVGAHKGNYTDIFLSLSKKSKFFLFEPNIYLYRNLLSKYKYQKNIKIYNYGLGEKNYKKNFFINRNSDYISTFANINKKSQYLFIRNLLFGSLTNKFNETKVNMHKLDSVKFLKKKNIDLLKIDVEGYEEKVIDGGKLVLEKTKILLIEFHKDDMYADFNYKKIHKKIIKLHFKLHKIIKFPLMTWEDRIYIK